MGVVFWQGFALEVRGLALVLAGFCTGCFNSRYMGACKDISRFWGEGGHQETCWASKAHHYSYSSSLAFVFQSAHAVPCCAGLLSLQLTAACMRKAHRMDAVGLANMITSALKLGCIQPLQQPLQQGGQQQQQQHGQDDLGQKQGFVYADLLSAATKQVAYANGHAAGMLLSALTGLQQQLLPHGSTHQQQQQLEILQQQLVLWARFTAALSQRLRACAAVQQLPSADASRLCSTVSRLSGLLARQRAAAAAGMPQPQQQQQPQQQVAGAVLSAAEDASTASCLHDVDSRVEDGTLHDSPFSQTTTHDSSSSSSTTIELQALQKQYSQLQQQLRGLLSLAAQQVEQQASPRGATAAPASLADVSRVLYALAKTWVWPGWPAVLGLLQVYSQGVHATHLVTAAVAAAVAEGQQGRGGGRGGRQRKQQAQQQFATPAPMGIPALGFGGFGGGGRSAQAVDDEQTDAAADVLTAALESLAPTLWAAGRLVEQQLQQQQHRRPRGQQQQQQWLLQELQHHQQLWKSLGPVLTVCQQQLSWLGPLQLAQVAAGLGKVVASSRALLDQAGAAAAAASAGSAADAAPMSLANAVRTAGSSAAASDLYAQLAGAAEGLAEVLAAPELRRLLQQHMARVESLLPLLALQHRLQIATAYSHLGQQVPQSVASVFARDQASQQH